MDDDYVVDHWWNEDWDGVFYLPWWGKILWALERVVGYALGLAIVWALIAAVNFVDIPTPWDLLF